MATVISTSESGQHSHRKRLFYQKKIIQNWNSGNGIKKFHSKNPRNRETWNSNKTISIQILDLGVLQKKIRGAQTLNVFQYTFLRAQCCTVRKSAPGLINILGKMPRRKIKMFAKCQIGRFESEHSLRPIFFFEIKEEQIIKRGINLSASQHKGYSHTYNTRIILSRLQRIYRIRHLTLRVAGTSLCRQ